MKKFLALALALVLVLGMFAGCGNSDTPAADNDKVYEFTLSMHDPKTTPNAIYMQSWIDKIAEATDGRVKITLYDNSTLSAATDIGVKVAEGAVDIGWLYTSYYAGQFPLADVINLPFQGFGDPIVSTNVLWDLYDAYPEMQEEWGDYKLLMLYGNPGMMFASADAPITCVADLAGRSMRCPAGAITDLLTTWGANPIPMPPPEVYESIEKGVISGYIFEPSGITNFSLEEVTKYYTDLPMYDGPFALIMNMDQWNSLPEDLQQIIEGLSGKEASLGAAQAFADAVNVAREDIVAAGGEFVEVSDEAKAEFAVEADKYAATWSETQGADGFDAAGFLAKAKELAASYAG